MKSKCFSLFGPCLCMCKSFMCLFVHMCFLWMKSLKLSEKKGKYYKQEYCKCSSSHLDIFALSFIIQHVCNISWRDLFSASTCMNANHSYTNGPWGIADSHFQICIISLYTLIKQYIYIQLKNTWEIYWRDFFLWHFTK